MKQYDYIITGAGCAGLSLLLRMIKSNLLSGSKILLIDRESKEHNDRTWCFWEEGEGFFEELVYKKWGQVVFHGKAFSKKYQTAPYQYKMIRGIDFYRYCFEKIAQQPNIDIWKGEITEQRGAGDDIEIVFDNKTYHFQNAKLFTSIWDEHKTRKEQPNAIFLLQHFKGWLIETPDNRFNPDEAVLMDFRVDQRRGTTFGYVLPLDSRHALVEYTLFTENLLSSEEYDIELSNYLHQWIQLTEYSITAKEFGVIPMTTAKFPWYSNGVYHIGTAGGQTKASSGYTFQFIQRQTDAIVKKLSGGDLQKEKAPFELPARYRFYDSILLRILSSHKLGGDEIFTRIFERNDITSIFRFLDNNSSITEDLSIVKSLPAGPFAKAALEKLTGKF